MAFIKKTVFILGAGSSEKFPLGPQLIREIVADPSFAENPSLHANGISKAEYLGFISQLRYADPSSIDAFLEENPDLIKIGRYAIAFHLMKREDELDLFPPRSVENTWYKKLADELGITKFGKPSSNELKIFTYNYERSLEHYLTRVIENRMRINEESARNIRERIPIYHLHGSLGSLHPQYPGHRPYSNIMSDKYLKIAAENIRIISEQSDEYDCSEDLRKAFPMRKKYISWGLGIIH